MFGIWRKAKGRTQIGPMIDGLKAHLAGSGLHMAPLDWDDPYLYGYMHGGSFVILKHGSAGKLEGSPLLDVQMWAWQELTALPNSVSSARVWTFIERRDDAYFRGSDLGIKWGSLLMGAVNRRTASPDLLEDLEAGRITARFAAMKGPEIPDHQAAAALVLDRDFIDYIRRKLNRVGSEAD